LCSSPRRSTIDHRIHILRGGGSTMLNRREFLTGLGLTAAAPARPTDKMRFAMSGHEFVTTLPHPAAGIKMTAEYGYHGLEPSQVDVAKSPAQPPDKLKPVRAASGIALCTVAWGGQYPAPAKFPAALENNASRARSAAFFGCKHLKVNLSKRA